jgi:hypothetical protein
MADPTPSAGPPVEWLSAESERWVADGLITRPQRTVLGTRYGFAAADEPPETATRIPLPTIVLGAGLGLLAIGLLLVVAANWGVLPYWLRLVLVAIPGALAAYAAPRVERPGWRHIAGQFVDAIVAASLLGFAAVISQHTQQSIRDWIELLLVALVPTLIYLELRRSTFLATAGWVTAAGLGVLWLHDELVAGQWGNFGLNYWVLYAMGLTLALRTRGYWTPPFALLSGLGLGCGLIIIASEYPGPVLEGTLVGVVAAVAAIGICAWRLWQTPTRTWLLAQIYVVAVSVALLWFNLWDRLIAVEEEIVPLLIYEGTWWLTATVTAIVMVLWLLRLQRRHEAVEPLWYTLRWVMLLYAIAGAFAGVGQVRTEARIVEATVQPLADAGILLAGLLTVAVTWYLLNRVPLLRTGNVTASQPQRSWLLTAGAPLAAGTVAWVLWLPVARLIAAVEPDVLEGLFVALAQWGLTVLSAVWIVVLLAQQAEAAAGRVARVIWALVIVLSLLLLIVAYVQEVSLLLRGLTFLSVGVILLFSTVGRGWLPFGRRGASRSAADAAERGARA